MKAVGYKIPGPIADAQSLVDIELPMPAPTGRDILVEVKAVSVNPVDYKVRRSTPPQDDEWKVLGWDAAGIVSAVGPDVTMFQPGDEVFYAGSITRSRHQCRVPPGRRAHRRPQAGVARLGGGGGASADLAHRMGEPVSIGWT